MEKEEKDEADQARWLDGSSQEQESVLTQQGLTHKNKQMAQEMRELEALVKEKLRSGWNSVRKAFLELDGDFDGQLTAEELFKVFGS